MCRNKPSVAKSLLLEAKKKVFTATDHSLPTHLDASSENETTLLIDPLEVYDLVQHSPWLSTLGTTLGNITCKLDTGAEANVLPVSAYNKLLNRTPLKPTYIKLTAYDGSSINPIDTCILPGSSSKDKSHNMKFYVVTVDSQPILGLKDNEKPELVKRVDTVEIGQLTKYTIKERYEYVFTGFGNLGKYHITLKENYTPVVNPLRWVPHFLKERLRQSINVIVKSGVLVKVY